jgi:hypothetical protein
MRLRSEQIEALLADAQAAVVAERAAARQARWEQLVPNLEAAEPDTADAIRTYTEASTRFSKLHWHALQAGIHAELHDRFVTPPHMQHNPWVAPRNPAEHQVMS